MLSRFVRIQLAIFTVVGIIGVIAMVLFYIQVPTLLGIGKMTVTLELPATGGLYRFSNVTYRGVQVGKVTSVGLTASGAKATLSLNTSPKIPANLQADVRSISAVGEQYVDLRPKTDSPPYLRDGSVIPMSETTIPQAVGPLLEQVNALIKSVPKNKISQLLDESFQSFNGEAYDLGSLSDSASRISADANSVADRTRTLTEDSQPLLDSQARTTDSIRTWARSLAGISDVLVTDDSRIRTLLQNGPDAANEASRLLEQVKPTLPVLLANLTTIGQIAVTYHPSLEQLLVLLPTAVAIEQAAGPTNHPDGFAEGDFALTIDDPLSARSASCRPANGAPRPTPATSTHPTTCIASSRRIHRFQFAAHVTIPAWTSPASGHPRSKSARATSRTCRWRCVSTRSVPTRWIPICFRRASRPTIGSPPATGCTPRPRNAAAARSDPSGNARRAAGCDSTTGDARRGRSTAAVVGTSTGGHRAAVG